MVSGISLGKNSAPILLDSDGVYVFDVNNDKISQALNIASDPNASLAAASSQIMSNSAGVTSFIENGEKYLLFYGTVPDVNWKLGVTLLESEMNESVNSIRTFLLLIGAVALIVCVAIITLLALSIVKNVNSVKAFAGDLAKGDFTIAQIKTKSSDELGQMSLSLNNMYESNKTVITQVE